MRYPVALLFVATGVTKLTTGGLRGFLAGSGMFPHWSVAFLSIAVPLAELLLAVLLLWPAAERVGWLGVAGLGTAFGVLHVGALLAGDVTACSCAGFRVTHSAAGEHWTMITVCGILVVAAVRLVRVPMPYL